jgi:hypothetical protein
MVFMDGAFFGLPEVEEGQGFSGFTCALSKVYACHSHLSAAEKTLCKNSFFPICDGDREGVAAGVPPPRPRACLIAKTPL